MRNPETKSMSQKIFPKKQLPAVLLIFFSLLNHNPIYYYLHHSATQQKTKKYDIL